MAAPGIVIPPQPMDPTRRELALRLLGGATEGSIMLFEETVPPGTKSWFHLHHDSDEVAYVISGEVTFMIGGETMVGGAGAIAFMPRGVPHCWKSTGAETGRVLFLYTPAKAGGFLEWQRDTGLKLADLGEREAQEILDRYGWKRVGENPL
jgi:quercetin dioxygenase-like cupin family protein